MSIADAVAPHLPYLRRFARALTGTQGAGDAAVVAALEAVVADPACLDSDNPRIALYRVFLRRWRGQPERGGVARPAGGADGPEARNLAAIAPAPRIAFLLHALEAFAPKDVARILDVSGEEAQALLDRAARQVSEQLRTSALIIEDEPLIAADLRSLVEELGHEVTTIARTHDEAVRAAVGRRPGLILSDIQLADGSSGLDAVNDILESL